MDTKKIVKGAVKGLKIAAAAIVTGALVESGYQGGKMLCDDIELTVRAINDKINPTVTYKQGLFGKPKTVNLRTGKCDDGTIVDEKTLNKLRKN